MTIPPPPVYDKNRDRQTFCTIDPLWFSLTPHRPPMGSLMSHRPPSSYPLPFSPLLILDQMHFTFTFNHPARPLSRRRPPQAALHNLSFSFVLKSSLPIHL
ncbi:hypothetical protein T11_6036 [Trichinella zimbabwensis]|uniref:Uncharacterized protein n=1 Tax=Trichinella zimbabwensis TaxID=268475 RepID=A0A0V1GQW3_9BILA|nr:hypothetical protein T11_6036 [Trichinella zimbabwensis]